MPTDLEIPDSIFHCSQHLSQRIRWAVSQHENLDSSQEVAPCVEKLCLPAAMTSTIYCRVHEDNASALLLANSQHLNNQNKYLAVKLYHFWSHVKPGVIEVVKCDTKLMLADPFTKPLV
jgi:hypothetical protein